MVGTTKASQPSAYQPSEAITRLTADVQRDYAAGQAILEKSYMEFNDRSVVEDMNSGQLMMNAFVDTSIDDPRDAWKYRGTRSKARNKAIAMVANLAGNILIPAFSAQNDDDEVDRDFSDVMRDGIEWMASPDNSNYQSSFLQAVFGMMANPVTYVGVEYCEVMQSIKEMHDDGSYSKKEIIDQVLSGAQFPVYNATEILIRNAYERNIQKQKRIIKRRWVEKSELEAKYGNHPNWEYVQAGQRSIYNDETGAFYDVKDTEHVDLVSEDTVIGRREDMEVCFLGGIYMGNDDVEANPVYHRDNFNAPKYNVVPFGYSRIGEHFFYFKSLMNAMRWDNDLLDAMTETVVNRSFLEVDQPVVFSGVDDPETDILFPGSAVILSDKEAKAQTLLPPANIAAGINAIRETEASMDEGSVSPTLSGQLPEASQKAYSVAQSQANSKRLVGVAARSLAESVCMLGDLMKDVFINHYAAPQVEEMLGGSLKLKYRSFMLKQKSNGGRRSDKRLRFDPTLIGMDVSDDEKEAMEIELLEGAGYPDHKESILAVNPELMAKYHYLSRVDSEEVFAKNSEYWQPVLMNLLTALANNPYADMEALTHETMYAFFQSRGDEFVKKAPPANAALPPGQNPNQQMPSQYMKDKSNPLSTEVYPTAVG